MLLIGKSAVCGLALPRDEVFFGVKGATGRGLELLVTNDANGPTARGVDIKFPTEKIRRTALGVEALGD